jgi:hypothetical protein
MYDRMSDTELYNLSREHQHNVESRRDEIQDKYGIDVDELFSRSDSYSSGGEGLSMQPIVDLFNLVVWAYSTPTRAIVSSVTFFTAAIHFGFITIPPIIFLITKWIGAGMVVTSSTLLAREMVIKINGKPIKE